MFVTIHNDNDIFSMMLVLLLLSAVGGCII